ncbi:MAG: COQ9 family protein [Rickettsiales bacterium]|nr:MAG: COQ9 family protein [Rickettsiales bacterium]
MLKYPLIIYIVSLHVKKKGRVGAKMTDISRKQAERRLKFFAALAKLLATNMWSEALLGKVEESCAFDKGYNYALFPEGVSQIAVSFESWQDEQMLSALSKTEKPAKIRECIARALEIRIMDVVHKNVAINNSGFFMMPQNILEGNKAAFRTCDLIWKYAGDQSADFNYYTKRGLLLSVYKSASAFYFADNSKDHEKTKIFIKNALDNIVNIASLKSRIKLPKIPKMEDLPILRLFS